MDRRVVLVAFEAAQMDRVDRHLQIRRDLIADADLEALVVAPSPAAGPKPGLPELGGDVVRGREAVEPASRPRNTASLSTRAWPAMASARMAPTAAATSAGSSASSGSALAEARHAIVNRTMATIRVFRSVHGKRRQLGQTRGSSREPREAQAPLVEVKGDELVSFDDLGEVEDVEVATDRVGQERGSRFLLAHALEAVGPVGSEVGRR